MEKQAASLANYSFGERAIHEHTMASRVTQKMQSTYHGTRGDPFGEFMGLNDTNMGPFVTRAILLQHIQL
ncbi:hypothetical protein AnigIFM63309_000288 [Aspergillus niger]|nr:hypothetical protein AnigIFM63309_000288 [Aspergillus niger]